MLDNTILTVSVPATSANIGVGYDTLGLAFNLRAKIAFRESPTLIIDGCPEQFRNENNLVWTSYVRACEKLGEEPTPKHITINSPIPLSGGLGSSSTCVIAGVACALQESHSGWDPERALDLACRIEGHPDNIYVGFSRVVVFKMRTGIECFEEFFLCFEVVSLFRSQFFFLF